jgi:hypothetical protein
MREKLRKRGNGRWIAEGLYMGEELGSNSQHFILVCLLVLLSFLPQREPLPLCLITH